MNRIELQWTGRLPARCLLTRFFAHQKANGSRPGEFTEVLGKHSLYASCFQRQCVRFYDQNARTEFLRQKSQQNTVPPLLPFAAQPYGEESQRKWYRSSSKRGRSRGDGAPSSGFFSRGLKRLMKFVGGVLAISGAAVAGAPYFISWPFGLDIALYLINSSIPGTLSVESVSLGWNEPVLVEGVRLEGADSNVVLTIPEYKTSAHLWTLFVGKTGLGDAVVVQPTIDMRKDPKTGHLHYDLALTSVDKLNVINPYVKKNFKVLPSEVLPWTAKVQASGGGLEVLNGKVILPGDVATVLGSHLFFEIALGSSATTANASLWMGREGRTGRTPIRCSLWSNCAHLEGQGYLNFRRKRMELLQPIIAEMDLSPALAKFYLAQINPILGQIVGPSIGRENLPDVIMHVKPAEMVWPANEYFIRIEPMKVVLAKGPLLHDLLSLLSRGDLEKGNRQITMQTSAVEANVHVGGTLVCSRVDLLIAEVERGTNLRTVAYQYFLEHSPTVPVLSYSCEVAIAPFLVLDPWWHAKKDKVHVATWGFMDHVHETMKMTLAIPGKSLRDLLGLTRISPDYHLQIPIHGTFDRPQVDWISAARGITQLTIQQNLGGNLFSAFLEQFDDNTDHCVVPKPIGDLPWAKD